MGAAPCNTTDNGDGSNASRVAVREPFQRLGLVHERHDANPDSLDHGGKLSNDAVQPALIDEDGSPRRPEGSWELRPGVRDGVQLDERRAGCDPPTVRKDGEPRPKVGIVEERQVVSENLGARDRTREVEQNQACRRIDPMANWHR